MMHISSHRQLQYTCTFLQVSFQAVKRSLGTPKSGAHTQATAQTNAPCWLDAQLITMLLREMRRARADASGHEPTCQALDSAIYHSGLLLVQCPGSLSRQLCEHHLEAIIVPLQQAAQRLALANRSQGSPATGFNILKRWRNH
ncbi:MAG: hypothetical protein ACTH3D_08120 [Halomonas sp.]|uniref:hypothetical protein n=1 Tax=Halomonas sp. TaxID=1486246 RepID=UPI003F915ED6